MSKKSQPHDEAMLEMFERDPRTFISYVWETLHEQDRRIAALEVKIAMLETRPPSVPVTARNRFEYPTYPPSGHNFNPWMNQKWSSGATPEMFGMKEKKP